MPLKFKQHIESLLKKNRDFSDSNGNLDINSILESIDKIDIELIKILKDDKNANERFFVKCDDIYILEQNKLIEFFTQNDYMKNGSFTSYTNKIGLIRKDNFIKKFDDVVLAWPHKDCILEGGQTKDDDKNKEVFYNEILNNDEIDRLFEPKVLSNIKRYSKNKIEENPTIKDHDNLIIKGNNLLALHSLKKKYAGKVKLIYIDPPYNTGNDSFKYNDNFNHSSWLTFMKNRLEVAREFLSDDGVIFVQCDDNEDSYLKVLMDEVFHPNLYVATISVKSNSISGNKTQHKDKTILKNKDSILVYKNNLRIKLNPQYTEKFEWDTHYNSILFEENDTTYSIKKLKDMLIEKSIIDEKYTINSDSIKNIDFYNYIFQNKKTIFRPVNSIPKELELLSLENKNSIVYTEDNSEKMFAYNGTRLSFLDKSFKNIDGEDKMAQLLGDLWVDLDFQNTQNQGGVSFPAGKKPEKLIQRIIDMTTNPNDLVMDFHLGSGTTCAVAHKMNRRYIGIEQMDYIEDISVERMKKVIDGEQGGISKAVDWNGGGEFVYAELKEIDNFKNSEIGKLNKTMKYLPISEIEDEDYGITKEEITINKAFYGIDDE